jgi:hypothetical protein
VHFIGHAFEISSRGQLRYMEKLVRDHSPKRAHRRPQRLMLPHRRNGFKEVAPTCGSQQAIGRTCQSGDRLQRALAGEPALA